MPIINQPTVMEQLLKPWERGLSTGLQQLMSMKMQDITRRKKMAGMEALGLPGAAADVDPRLTQQYMQQQQGAQQSQRNLAATREASGVQPGQGAVEPSEGVLPGGAFQGADAPTKKMILDERRRQQEAIKKTHIEAAKELKVDTEVKAANNEIIRNAKSLNKLLDSGKVWTGPAFRAAEKLGLDSFLNPETHIAKKNTAVLLEQAIAKAKSTGTKMTEMFIKVKKDTNPTLDMKEVAIKSLVEDALFQAKKENILISEGEKVKNEAVKQGVPRPDNWREIAERNATPKIEELEYRFKNKVGRKIFKNLMQGDPEFRAKYKAGEFDNGKEFKLAGNPVRINRGIIEEL